MRYLISSAAILLALTFINATPIIDHHGHDHHNSKIHLEHSTEKVKQQGSSSSHATNSSSSHAILNRQEWTSSSKNTNQGREVKTDTRSVKNEAGSNSQSEATDRARHSSDESRKDLTVNGKEIESTHTGSRTQFAESKTSSSSNQFQKNLEVEKSKTIIQQRLDLRCMEQRKVVIFLVVHVNENWMKKFQFVRKMLNDAYEPGRVDFYCVFFNGRSKVLNTAGGRYTKEYALEKLMEIQNEMKQQQKKFYETWRGFELIRALDECRGAASMMKLFRQDAKLIMISYFDKLDQVLSNNFEDIHTGLENYNWPEFDGRMCMMQDEQLANQKWKQIANKMSSDQKYLLPILQESTTVKFLAKMVGKLCTMIH